MDEEKMERENSIDLSKTICAYSESFTENTIYIRQESLFHFEFAKKTTPRNNFVQFIITEEGDLKIYVQTYVRLEAGSLTGKVELKETYSIDLTVVEIVGFLRTPHNKGQIILSVLEIYQPLHIEKEFIGYCVDVFTKALELIKTHKIKSLAEFKNEQILVTEHVDLMLQMYINPFQTLIETKKYWL